jgi:hypothetical protein
MLITDLEQGSPAAKPGIKSGHTTGDVSGEVLLPEHFLVSIYFYRLATA